MENFDKAMMEQLKPFFYLIGFLVVSQFGMLLKLFLSKSDKHSEKVDTQLEQIKEALNESSRHIIKIETKFDLFVDHYEKDLNNLGQKIRELSV